MAKPKRKMKKIAVLTVNGDEFTCYYSKKSHRLTCERKVKKTAKK